MPAAVIVKQEADDTFTVDFKDEMTHMVLVSILAREVGREMGLDEETCRELGIAGLVHDIGKLQLVRYDSLEEGSSLIDEMGSRRVHAQLGYEILREQGYSDFILQSVRYHHENQDGTGYPDNLHGSQIPIGAKILHVCDSYISYCTDRIYREAFNAEDSMRLMIEEASIFDMGVLLAFQRVMHREDIQKTLQDVREWGQQ